VVAEEILLNTEGRLRDAKMNENPKNKKNAEKN
jgi:hypothetical protein